MAKRATIKWRVFGRCLREARMAHDLGLREVARQTGIDKACWCRAENGKPVSPENYISLCDWMGASPFDYFKPATVSRQES